jgi:hypothetical protein
VKEVEIWVSLKGECQPLYSRQTALSLTDGVFAIVMTLLVLDITIPEIAYPSLQAELPQKLLELWPKLFRYALSFIVLGLFWGFHHLAFHSIKRSDMDTGMVKHSFPDVRRLDALLYVPSPDPPHDPESSFDYRIRNQCCACFCYVTHNLDIRYRKAPPS